MRIAAEYQDIEEWVKIEAGNPTANRERGLTKLITRATFHWEPTENIAANLTSYRYVYEDQQVRNFDPAVFAFVATNAGEFTTTGLDVDFVWVTPISGLSFSGFWAFLDAELTGDLFNEAGQNLKGRDGGFDPELPGNLAINRETKLGDALALRVSPNFAYRDDYIVGGASPDTFDPVTNPLGDLVQDSCTTVDLDISLSSINESWRISLIGRNLTDEQYLTFAGPAPFRPPTGDDQLVGLGGGKQVFVEAAFKL